MTGTDKKNAERSMAQANPNPIDPEAMTIANLLRNSVEQAFDANNVNYIVAEGHRRGERVPGIEFVNLDTPLGRCMFRVFNNMIVYTTPTRVDQQHVTYATYSESFPYAYPANSTLQQKVDFCMQSIHRRVSYKQQRITDKCEFYDIMKNLHQRMLVLENANL